MKKILILVMTGLLYFGCKKTDRGRIEAGKILYAENGDWYVLSMEVNGADSTTLYFPKYETHVKTRLYTFKPKEDNGTVEGLPPIILTFDHRLAYELSEDGTKCIIKGAGRTCLREPYNLPAFGQPYTLYLPSEKKARGAYVTWTIDKLLPDALVLTCTMSKSYKISFVRASGLNQ